MLERREKNVVLVVIHSDTVFLFLTLWKHFFGIFKHFNISLNRANPLQSSVLSVEVKRITREQVRVHQT